MKYKVGDKIKFLEEKQKYTIRAIGKRYAICTKLFNPKKTILYTVVDFRNNIRGRENIVFEFGAESDKQCLEMLERLESNETEISRRNYIKLNIENDKYFVDVGRAMSEHLVDYF